MGNSQTNLLITATLPFNAPLRIRDTIIMINDLLSPNMTVEPTTPQSPKRSIGRRPILSDREPQKQTANEKVRCDCGLYDLGRTCTKLRKSKGTFNNTRVVADCFGVICNAYFLDHLSKRECSYKVKTRSAYRVYKGKYLFS